MRATLYGVHSSHPAHAARLMLEYKGIEHKVVNLVPGTHAALLRPLGFRHGTVPAIKLDGRRVQGSRSISRVLDEVRPDPPLFPADPDERGRVEAAERWGDEVLQPVPRRLAGWLTVHRAALRSKLAREAGVPAAGLVGAANKPLAWYFAHKIGATDFEGVTRTAESLPDLLDHVDGLIAARTIGGEQPNAADFQILATVRLLMTIEDLAPVLEGRPSTHLARELMPDYPTGVPAGLFPQRWLDLLA